MKSESVAIQMNATEQFFPVLLFIMLYKAFLSFESVYEILKCDIQVKANKQYFPVVLFICCIRRSFNRFETVDETKLVFL